jgi:hypothetical protein
MTKTARVRRRRALLAAAASAGLLVASVLGAAPAPATTPATGSELVPVSLCSTPAPGHVACYAQRLVRKPVRRATAGVRSAASRLPGARRPQYTGGPAGGYSPANLASAYRVNPATRTTQTVAIVDAHHDPAVRNDLDVFDRHYGLPAETSTSLRVVNQAGKPSPLPTRDAGWAGEITLDVQAVRGLCHKCRILLVEAGSDDSAALAAGVNTAVRLGAKIVSNSYGGPTLDSQSVQDAYRHHGVAVIAASGDSGWYGWDWVNEGVAPDNGPSYPASYSTVVGVGGTSLYLNANGTRATETVWNSDGPGDYYGRLYGAALGASGGGCSTAVRAPLWQRSVRGYSTLGCGTRRNGVDVAAVADPSTGFDVYQSYGNPDGAPGWGTIGGTSLAAPVIAALWGLAGGPGGVWYPALSLYSHYAADQARPSHDVTAGGSGYCGTATPTDCSTANPNTSKQELDCAWDTGGVSATVLANRGQCYAQRGYDGVSGIGTPNGLNAFKPAGPAVTVVRPSVVKLNVRQTWSARFSDPAPGGTAGTYVWDWGDGTRTTTTATSVTHRFTKAGTHRLTLTVKDNYQRTGTTARTIRVGLRPSAVISGPTTVRVNRTMTWSSRRSTTRNTGAVIAARSWSVKGTRIGTSTSLQRKFTHPGDHTLTLTVVDSSGRRGTTSVRITAVR